MKKFLAAVCLLGLAGPAVAQEFYVVRGPDQRCQIVETRPTDKQIVVLGDKAYVTREEADRQLRVVCQDTAQKEVIIKK